MLIIPLLLVAGSLSAAEGQTPGGYLFFARRQRTTPTTWSRVEEPAGGKSAKRREPCCKTAEDVQAPRSPLPVTASSVTSETPVATTPETPAVQQVTWGTVYGLGYGWPEEGYYPGTPSYGFGTPIPYPLHGYRAKYDWAGHTYAMHCYCAKGYCPFHCPGYRGECYVPCWNDAGTPIFERRCGRGSCWDAFWHMGGYERPCRKTDCPNVCIGPPAYDSCGFPHGAPGDPNYVKPRGTGTGEPWRMSHDPYGSPTPPRMKRDTPPAP